MLEIVFIINSGFTKSGVTICNECMYVECNISVPCHCVYERLLSGRLLVDAIVHWSYMLCVQYIRLINCRSHSHSTLERSWREHLPIVSLLYSLCARWSHTHTLTLLSLRLCPHTLTILHPPTHPHTHPHPPPPTHTHYFALHPTPSLPPHSLLSLHSRLHACGEESTSCAGRPWTAPASPGHHQ